MYNVLKTTAIQNELILNYNQYNITNEEFICICQLLTIDCIHIDLLDFLRKTQNNKPQISSLVSKQIINLGEKSGKMTIDLGPLYKKLDNPDETLSEVGLTTNQIDKLVHIFGRQLNPNELNKINSWMRAGATFTKIEEAIYTALGREITNLNYIEKIIVNSNSTTDPVEKKEGPLKRNWTY